MSNERKFITDYVSMAKVGYVDGAALIEEAIQQMGASGAPYYEMPAREAATGTPELFHFDRVGDGFAYVGT